MNFKFRESIFKIFSLATAVLFGVVYFFRDKNPKIIIGYAIVYFVFWFIFMIYAAWVIISELRNAKLEQLKSNILFFMGSVAIIALLFYGMDYIIKPEKFSIERSVFKGIKASIWILVAKIMLKDKKLSKSG